MCLARDEELTMACQCHAVSQHVSRRSLLSHPCEWLSCGNLFLDARALANHLAQQHIGFFRQVVCFCGQSMATMQLDLHEKV